MPTPITTIILVLTLGAAILGEDLGFVVGGVAALANQGLFSWASRPTV